MQMGPGMDPTTLARVIAHGKKIEEQMRRIQGRFDAIRGTAARLGNSGEMLQANIAEVDTFATEGIVAVEELSRLMAVNPADLMMGGEENAES